MAKKSEKSATRPSGEFIAVVDLKNDKTRKEFVAGETVSSGDFPEKVIEHWLKIGVLREGKDGR